MDRHQREVIRRKRPIMADLLDFSVASQKEYKEMGLLIDEMLNDIKNERTEFSKVFKWLELLPMRGNDAFDQMATLLTTRGFAWLSYELYADLESEQGTLHIEEYVFREAGLLVHKNYGRSKRISEVEKKEMQKLLADRYQTSKEAYTRQVKDMQRKLDDALNSKSSEGDKMKGLVQRIHAYLRVEHDRLDDTAHGIEGALDVIASDPDMNDANIKDFSEILNHALEGLFDILSRELYQKEVHDAERARCIELLMKELGAEEDKPVFHVDYMLEEVIKNYAEILAHAKTEADVSNKLAKSMEDRFNNLKAETDRMLAGKEEQTLRLEAEIITKAGVIAELQKKELVVQEQIDRSQEDLGKWKNRYDQVERTRRIGYYQGAYDKQYYDVNSRNTRRKPAQQWRMTDWEDRNRRSLKDEDAFHKMLVEHDEDDISFIDMKDKKLPIRNGVKLNGAVTRSDSVTSSNTTPPITESRYMVATRPGVPRKKKGQKEPTRGGGGRWL